MKDNFYSQNSKCHFSKEKVIKNPEKICRSDFPAHRIETANSRLTIQFYKLNGDLSTIVQGKVEQLYIGLFTLSTNKNED